MNLFKMQILDFPIWDLVMKSTCYHFHNKFQHCFPILVATVYLYSQPVRMILYDKNHDFRLTRNKGTCGAKICAIDITDARVPIPYALLLWIYANELSLWKNMHIPSP